MLVVKLCLSLWLLLNIYTFIIYGIDKRAALRGSTRVSEFALLSLAVAGGWFGAILAQRVWRHKTSKKSFQVRFWIATIINLIIALIIWVGINVE